MKPIRVVIADDHPILLEGLEQLLRRDSRFAPIGRATTAEETLNVVAREQPDILILDVRMPGDDGLSVLRRLGSTLTRVVLLTAGITPEEAAEAIALGARAILLKQRTATHLLKCLGQVHEGFLWLTRNCLHVIVAPGARRSAPVSARSSCLWHRACETRKSPIWSAFLKRR